MICHTRDELLNAAYQVTYSYYVHNHDSGVIEFLHREEEDRHCISIKGTAPNRGTWGWTAWLVDLLTDIRFFPAYDKVYGMGWVPSGFLDAAEQFTRYFLKNRKTFCNGKPIWLMGHSLGGAVLLIAAPVMYQRGLFIESAITFGAPNVGKIKSFPEEIRCSFLKNGKDIFTEVPTFYGDKYTTTKIGEETGFFSDHNMNSYIRSIRNLKD